MSRSIHTTRRDIVHLLHAGASPERLGQALEELRAKHFIKRSVLRRRLGTPHPPQPVEPCAIPVRVRDEGPYVHHAASPEDVREVLRRLPRGTVDGLAAVEMRMGSQAQAKRARQRPEGEAPDPFTGRLGFPLADGVWCARLRGRYRRRAAVIEIYAHVADPAHPHWPFWRWMLRYEALRTLVHEAAHHHDITCRVARGRWRAGLAADAEPYARDRERAWSRTVLVPYLAERYPEGDALLREHVTRAAEAGLDPFPRPALRWEDG